MNNFFVGKLRTIPFKDFEEHYITINGSELSSLSVDGLLGYFKKNSIRITRITRLGNLHASDGNMEKFSRYPVMDIGNSFDGSNCKLQEGGICIQAVGGKLKQFGYVKMDKEVIGAFFDSGKFRAISLSGMGRLADEEDFDLREAMDAMYLKIDNVLGKYDFSSKNIYRFWNLLSNVAVGYGELNEARNAYFMKKSIVDFPAATGIEASLGGNRNVDICADAIDAGDGRGGVFEVVSSNMQCEAWRYGPKFSRAARVSFPDDGIKKLFISGTSSIGKRGKSILKNDYRKNVAYTMASVKHLLEKNDMSLDNLMSAFVYVKNVEVYEEFMRLYGRNGWDFPYNLVFTNICRNDLLFEMECVAANKIKK